jgi:hypothetical protein
MGKKTGKGTQILIRLDKDPELLHEFKVIKRKMRASNNIEVVRRLIDEKYAQLEKERKIP